MCDYCGYTLEAHERVVRGDGRTYCTTCIGRLTDHLDPVADDLSAYLPA